MILVRFVWLCWYIFDAGFIDWSRDRSIYPKPVGYMTWADFWEMTLKKDNSND